MEREESYCVKERVEWRKRLFLFQHPIPISENQLSLQSILAYKPYITISQIITMIINIILKIYYRSLNILLQLYILHAF